MLGGGVDALRGCRPAAGVSTRCGGCRHGVGYTRTLTSSRTRRVASTMLRSEAVVSS